MQLNESLFYYNNAYRWKRTDLSSDFLHPLYKQALLKFIRDQERNINISDLEVEDVFIDNDRGVATIKIRISYLMTNETILHEEIISQYWIRDRSKWFFVGQSGSDGLNIPVPDEIRFKILLEGRDAGRSDN